MGVPSARRFTSSFLWQLMERGSFAVAQFVVQIVLARMLLPDDFGMLAIILAFVNVGLVLVQAGMNTALIQSPQLDEKDYSTVLWMCLGISLVCLVVLFACAPSIAAAFDLPSMAMPLRATATMLVAAAFTSVAQARLTREMRFREVFVTSCVSVVLSGVLGAACAFFGLGVWALVAQQVSYQFAFCVALLLALRWHPAFEFDLGRARVLFSYGWKLLASNLLESGYQGLTDLIVGSRFSSTSLGMVSQGKRWPQAVAYLLDGSIQPVALSAISKAQSDVLAVKRMVRKTMCVYVYLACPLMVTLAVCAEPVVLLLLGQKWLPCVPYLRMYCIVYALLPIHTTNLQAMAALGRSELYLKLDILKKAYGVAFVLAAAFAFNDILWVLGSYVAAGVLSVLVNAAANGRLFGYTLAEQARDTIPSFVLALACAAIAWPISHVSMTPVLKLVALAAVVLGAYVCVSWLLHLRGFIYARGALMGLLHGSEDGGQGQ